ncbi:Cysteine/Histidine-rich C1 domain family protein [Arabidopsis thaliana]|uniref:Cysteine/Histidine-rich C1 domain family protein n=2 Tax=Arabidopsis thaliana TaxID=3702 RepID=Q8W2D2_ARATH|nr:Cysteine/Histidine-rich C1 domain family protein [Arabidopsis thaliana]AAL37222.1 ULI3 [Arabidopsis thaliana]AED97251.1 Cysteine/Histidine-rich C1 domain family protein [Arabidopsis thaliana]CAA0410964.1 unnamed protein product [Arabidopsis thaliana]|eukprot:NP_200800.1 Cysteine/Histidine-rich C1 domain family protein [Arabidopsis thaliana]
MATEAVDLPIHEHPLFPSARCIDDECDGCHVNGFMYAGYFCNEPYCYVWFHKDCAEAPGEISHSSHPEHPLLLTNDSKDGPCDLCGQKLLTPCYSCPTCEFKVDLTCGMKPSPPAIEHPLCHDHAVVFLKIREEKVPCELCKESIEGPSYSCLECDMYFHVNCVHLSEEVNHPCHSIHPLKLITSESLTDDAEKSCLLCGNIPAENMLYHCSVCNFTSCLGCTKNPPLLVIEHMKTHKHPLTLLPRRISCICDVCGKKCQFTAYVCLQCDFVTARKCIDRPRVININRHDHRIYLTHHLGTGYSECGVCHKNVSQYKGAYSCSVCPNYAVHSTCAVRTDVWDGVELEGTTEITEDISPFKVVGDNLICHFSHEEHQLKLHKEDVIHDERRRCEACIHPVQFGSIYVCEEEECCFVLHEKCANLPMKKRLVFGTRPYTLMKETTEITHCELCGILSDGFAYSSHEWSDVDVHCGSLNEPLVHDGHIHPLYFAKKEEHTCDGCQKSIEDYMLRCKACDFDLCLYCATLPEKIWHRNDGHPLTLCCGEKEEASGKYWCDICEKELDPSIWFYTCYDCGVTLHAQCVLGDFSRLVLGQIYSFGEKEIEFEAVPNNINTRPFCIQCNSRCKVSVILKILKDSEDGSDDGSDDVSDDVSDDPSNDVSDDTSDDDSDVVSDVVSDDASNDDSDDTSDDHNGYICSRSCLSSYLGEEI